MRLSNALRRSLAGAACVLALGACNDSSLDDQGIVGVYVLARFNGSTLPAPQACGAGGTVVSGTIVLDPGGTASHTLVYRSATNVQTEEHSTGTYTTAGGDVVLSLRTGAGPQFTLTAEPVSGGLEISRGSPCNGTLVERFNGPYVSLGG